MFVVNYLGNFDVIGPIWKHHNTYCSYADTIMPGFFFAVGFAFRLTLLRRLATEEPWPAYLKVLRRNLGLILVGIVIYHFDDRFTSWPELLTKLQTLGWWGLLKASCEREPFQTLVHIAITSLWVLPVVAMGPAVRLAFCLFSALLHLYLSRLFYFTWVWERPGIDGGPLGFMTWTIPLLAGTFAYDFVKAAPPARSGIKLLCWGIVLMFAGYGISCLGQSTTNADPPSWLAAAPFVEPDQPVNLWTMSQRSGSVSYLTFSAGFSLAVYALFVWLSDLGGLQIGMFRTLGSNALAAYIIHIWVMGLVKSCSPHDAPMWFALGSFGVMLLICYVFLRHLEKNGIYLKL
jgi:hypothetical protein